MAELWAVFTPAAVTLEAFLDGILHGYGSLLLSFVASPVLAELLELLNLCLQPASVLSESLPLFTWRVISIPKPKDPGATRPMAVASVLVRGFYRALLSSFPPLPPQRCGRPGGSPC